MALIFSSEPVSSDADPGDETDQQPDPVLSWRCEQLLAAGYDVEAALLLAKSGCDLHQAVRMLRHGATATQALSILL